MQITDSFLQLASHYEKTETSASLDVFNFDGFSTSPTAAGDRAGKATSFGDLLSAKAQETDTTNEAERAQKIEDIRTSLFTYLVKLLQNLRSQAGLPEGCNTGTAAEGIKAGDRQQIETPKGPMLITWEHFEHRETTESLSFSASGTVKTADGEERSFSVSMDLDRRESIDLYNSSTMAHLKDPLVLNLTGGAPAFGDQKVKLDLDCDGKQECVSFAAQGTAFLAIDHNGDGTVTDGSELFGAKTGQGFTELAAWDQDGNGWIDSADPVFDKLRLWLDDGQGAHLSSLAEKGIAAISVNHVATPFDVKNGDGDLLARLQATGVYLKNDGSAGVASEVLLDSQEPSAGLQTA